MMRYYKPSEILNFLYKKDPILIDKRNSFFVKSRINDYPYKVYSSFKYSHEIE